MSLEGRYDDLSNVSRLLGSADLVVGIPSRNTAHTIAYVLHNVVLGVRKYLKGLRVAVLVCDGFSSDGTVDIVKAYRRHTDLPIAIIPNKLSKGKGGAVKTVIDLVSNFSNAQSLILLDSDLRSVTPEWVALMYEGSKLCGLVTPLYLRHKYDATITNFIVRPLIVLTYGIDVEQPIGGDFALSRELVETLGSSDLWSSNPWALYFGVDVFITITALANGFEVCEALLKAKIHEPKDPALALKPMFIEVTGSTLTTLKYYLKTWLDLKVPTLRRPKVIDKPEVPDMKPWEVRVNPQSALRLYKEGMRRYGKYYEELLPHKYLGEGIDTSTWNYVLAKSLVRGIKSGVDTEFLNALYHIWQGRLYRYYEEVRELSDEDALKVIGSSIKELLKLRSEVVNSIKLSLSKR